MSVKIIYFVHGTTKDNEAGKCTGWAGGELSELGIRQARELPGLVRDKSFSALFSSDLKRALDSAQLGFQSLCPIVSDRRLRECDYGDLTQAEESLVDYAKQIDIPFPGGESLRDVEARLRSFLEDLKASHDGKFVAIMAHKAPQLALEVILNGKSWEEALAADWRHHKAWQPGWLYNLD